MFRKPTDKELEQLKAMRLMLLGAMSEAPEEAAKIQAAKNKILAALEDVDQATRQIALFLAQVDILEKK